MFRFVATMLTSLAVPALLAAQTPQVPNAHPSDTAKAKVAAAQEHRATHMRGSVMGPDNRPITPATPAVPATRATPATPASGGNPATPAVPAKPATPAVPAAPGGKPSNPGRSGSHRP
jgi:hypothetical protein